MPGSLQGHVCVVTGASRGIGRGIALQLCQAGATVYITGRNRDTLRDAAKEAQARGGRCVPVVCDSSQEDQVRSLFEQVEREHQGRLDLLVNNAYAGVQSILSNQKKPFWECPASIWDDINNVGLRGHYLCSVYGARLMVPAGRGLIVVISSPGGLRYLFNVPYGVGKAACDRLAADCAQELRSSGVSYVSLWPGLVQTELLKDHMNQAAATFDRRLRENFGSGETPEMSGRCVVALATDPQIGSLSGRVLPSCDLARRYGLRDVDGRPVADYLSVSSVLSQVPGLAWLARYVPSFLRMPKWILALYASKF
ncbi:LOW QUALITY PROTEIN: dehydrogenase/reductase SDR family member 1 [Ornithorhynchus anatinus]|uniref:LOW QUALITY PROTEIN: dehydrogenase/reductase SDR family member 1 n=1 Tax=Ornithorhynchus anatinus TaxID=9258 RepID=UPI0010A77A6B|nr:LOW QUALITY PROTEIN: dehydrogenase/reductase SDR family member 1 [Ornithorhynchus anatinus]